MPALSPVSSTSLSGMRVAQAALDASAHNIANLATPGFRRSGVVVVDSVSGGATASPTQAAQARQAIETDMVDQLVAKNLFLANLAVFKTGDQMLGTLLDTRR
jgi:flagellar hook protein FlgE